MAKAEVYCALSINGFGRAVFLLVFLTLTACREEAILHGLDESLANQILVVLQRAGVEVEKARDGERWEIRVADSQVHQALSVIENNRVLRLPEDSEPASLLQSREEKDFLVARKSARALEVTLERIPHVLEARVHLHQPSQDLLGSTETLKPDSASVLLVHQSSAIVNVPEVQKLVSGAVGLAPETVTVVLSMEADTSATAMPQPGYVADTVSKPVSVSTAEHEMIWYFLLLTVAIGLLVFVVQQTLWRPRMLRPALEAKSNIAPHQPPEALFQQAEAGAKVLRPPFELGRQCR